MKLQLSLPLIFPLRLPHFNGILILVIMGFADRSVRAARGAKIWNQAMTSQNIENAGNSGGPCPACCGTARAGNAEVVQGIREDPAERRNVFETEQSFY